jgi:D-lactate dehydrogenase
MRGFGCDVIAYDPKPSADVTAAGIPLVPLSELFSKADILSLHCPLNPSTKHLIDRETLNQCKRGLMLINTSRGALIDAPAAIEALKEGILGALGIDVYEDEADFFYEDYSSQIIKDDVLLRLIAFPNVLVTAHQGFFTTEAVTKIAETTLSSASDFAAGRRPACALVLCD